MLRKENAKRKEMLSFGISFIVSPIVRIIKLNNSNSITFLNFSKVIVLCKFVCFHLFRLLCTQIKKRR